MTEQEELALMLKAAIAAQDKAAADDLYQRMTLLDKIQQIDKESFVPTWQDRARSVASGAAFGFADEVEAAVRAPFSEQTFGEIRGDLTKRAGEYEDARPWEKLGLEMGAGALSGGGLFKAATAVPKFANLARGAQLTAAGALEGGLTGVGAGEGTQGRTVSGLMGAGVGGLLGAGGSRLERFSDDVLHNRNIASTIAGEGGVPRLRRDIDELNTGASAPWASVAHVRPGAAQAAFDVQPPGSLEFKRYMRGIQREMPARVDQQMTRSLRVGPQDRGEALADLERVRREAGEAMFNPLRGETVKPTNTMVDMLQVPPGRQAATAALNVERNARGNPNLELDDVTGGFPFWHNAQQVYGDYGRRRMTSDGALSGPEAGAAFTRQREVLNEMYSQPWGPQYQAARDAYRVNSQVIEALGNADAFAKLPRDELRRITTTMTPDERNVYAMGIVQNVREASRLSPDAADQARNVIKSAAMRENLGALIGARRAETLIDNLDRLSEGSQAYNRIFHGSKTASQLNQQAILGNATGDAGVIGSFLSGEFSNAARKALMPDAPKARVMSEKTAKGVLDLTMASTTPEIQAAMSLINQRRAWLNQTYIPSLLGAGAAASAGQF